MSTELQQRVEKLEQSNRNLKLVLGVLAILTLWSLRSLFIGGVPPAIDAQSFIVRSADGISTAAFEPSGISFYTKSGQIKARIEAGGHNPGVFIGGVKLGAKSPIVTSTVTP